jgi:hypothetical protein
VGEIALSALADEVTRRGVLHFANCGYAYFRALYKYTAKEQRKMARAQKQKQERTPISGIERLNLRVSNMINHPVAQLNRTVTIHRLDTDGDREWDEVMGVLEEVDGIEITFNDEPESVTLKWEATSDNDAQVEQSELEPIEEAIPF